MIRKNTSVLNSGSVTESIVPALSTEPRARPPAESELPSPPARRARVEVASDASSPRVKLDPRMCPPLNVASFPGGFQVRDGVEVVAIGDATALAQELQASILRLYGSYLSDDGAWVDYAALASSSDFGRYLEATARLRHIDLSVLAAEERKV